MKYTNITHLVQSLIQPHSQQSIASLIKQEKEVYDQLFEVTKKEEIFVTFENQESAAQFYYDMKYSFYALNPIQVFTVTENPFAIRCIVEGSVIDYLDSHHPGFLTYSLNTGLSFHIFYQQSFTSSILEADIMEGQLKHIRCRINFYQSLPQLSLGTLHHFIKNEEDVQRINPTVVIVQSENHA